MYLSERKICHSNNCLHFSKGIVPLLAFANFLYYLNFAMFRRVVFEKSAMSCLIQLNSKFCIL
jgi:hypothetical protein